MGLERFQRPHQAPPQRARVLPATVALRRCNVPVAHGIPPATPAPALVSLDVCVYFWNAGNRLTFVVDGTLQPISVRLIRVALAMQTGLPPLGQLLRRYYFE